MVVKKSVFLGHTKIKDLPWSDEFHVHGSLGLGETSIKKLPSGLTVDGYLDLVDANIREVPDGLTVGGDLYLCGTYISELPESLTVGGSLYLDRSFYLRSLPETLTAVNGILSLRYMGGLRSLPNTLKKVNGDLILEETRIESLPSKLTVGRDLNCFGSEIEKLPENLVVGRNLILGEKLHELPEGLTVGCDIVNCHCLWTYPKGVIMGGCFYDETHREYAKMLRASEYTKHLRNGEYVPGRYLYADGILTHVKEKRHVDGYDLYVGKIKGKNVVSDGIHYAHCDSFRDGIKDLAFKTAKDRGADQYSILRLDSIVQADDAITMYRVITGACRAGTQAFVDSISDRKESYTVAEIIELTEGQYGSEQFRKFFSK